MDTLSSILVFLTGVAIRLVIPILLTVMVVIVLRRVDIRWQKEAELERGVLIKDVTPCWKEQGLSLDEIKSKAEASGAPCWQLHRLPNGYLREECLDCEVFLSAPVPESKHAVTHA